MILVHKEIGDYVQFKYKVINEEPIILTGKIKSISENGVDCTVEIENFGDILIGEWLIVENRIDTISKERANKIYDILVEYGADDEMRQNFIYLHCIREDGCKEYRFKGKFGFGGKYWILENKVNYYDEDKNAEREMLLKEINYKLSKLGK